jgi:4-hydroxy 2-oxovalerate aldolase
MPKIQLNMKINFIECTLRDGGYHNNWDFDSELVFEYLKTMSMLNYKNIEFGFRFLDDSSWMGEFGYTTEATIEKYNPSSKFNLGVMINSSDFIKNDSVNLQSIDKSFPLNAAKSRLDSVRIATHIKDFEHSLKIAEYLVGKGYKLAVNIMQAHNLDKDLLVKFANQANEVDLTSLYIADSLGCLMPKDVQKIITILKENYQGELGIHAHDNMGFALINSIECILSGGSWLDSTITGMGRGPGNARTEEIFMYYMSKNDVKKNTQIVELIENHFSHLKEKYKWGSNPFYFLSALNKVHPSYIQDMEKDNLFSSFDKFSFLEGINKSESESYKPELKEKLNNFFILKNNKDHLTNKKFNNKNFLIIGAGPSVQKYAKDIEYFIKKKKPTVLQLNKISFVDESLVDFIVVSHPQRFFQTNLTEQSNTKYIVPNVKDYEFNISKNIFIYDIEISDKIFSSNKYFTKIPNGLALTYSLGIIEKNEGKKTIFTAGLDGYKDNLIKNSELNETIKSFHEHFKTSEVISLTPSRLDLVQKNVYSM